MQNSGINKIDSTEEFRNIKFRSIHVMDNSKLYVNSCYPYRILSETEEIKFNTGDREDTVESRI